jgi:integrator complex subunit 10
MAPAIGEVVVSDEEYLVLRAKDALKSDPFAAKAWMITAKTLFPNNFAVQVRNVFSSPELTNLCEVSQFLDKRLL